MISKLSRKRDARWSNGSPKARNSGSFQPEPTPSTKRPPLTSSIAAAMRAISPGGWNARQATSGPISTRSVSAAIAASSVQASHGPRSGSSVVAIEQVVAEPDRVEPDLLRGQRHRAVLGPAHVALDLGQLHSNAQRSAHALDSRRAK